MPIPTRMKARKSRLPKEGRTATGNCAVIVMIKDFHMACERILRVTNFVVFWRD